MTNLHTLKQWVKTSDHPVARGVFKAHQQIRFAEVPAVRFIYTPLRILHHAVTGMAASILRITYWTPMFKARLATPCKRLFLYGGMPLIQGTLSITVGDRCRLSGQTTFSGRWCSKETPQLTIGNNVGIGWQTTIAVGGKVMIGDNVRIAGRGFLAGYPGHPLDADARAAGQPDTDDQVGDIILERDVWLGTNVTVMKGVTIGEGTIVATGSVVTRDLPSGVLAAGAPAKVVKRLDTSAADVNPDMANVASLPGNQTSDIQEGAA